MFPFFSYWHSGVVSLPYRHLRHFRGLFGLPFASFPQPLPSILRFLHGRALSLSLSLSIYLSILSPTFLSSRLPTTTNLASYPSASPSSSTRPFYSSSCFLSDDIVGPSPLSRGIKYFRFEFPFPTPRSIWCHALAWLAQIDRTMERTSFVSRDVSVCMYVQASEVRTLIGRDISNRCDVEACLCFSIHDFQCVSFENQKNPCRDRNRSFVTELKRIVVYRQLLSDDFTVKQERTRNLL